MTPEEQEVARYVLGYFGAEGGWHAGGFTQLMMSAYQKADPGNKQRIRMGFPELADAMDTVLGSTGGIKRLQAKLGK